MIKLFSHDDFDGIGCGILAKLAFGENVDISYCNYDNIDSSVIDFINSETEFNMCFITDIRVNEETAKIIDNRFDNFYLLDHHPTALGLNKYNWCSVTIEFEDDKLGSVKTSGTEIFYYWLTKNGYLKESDTLQRFAELVRDYDTWRWAELGDDGIICKQVNDLLYLYGRDRFIHWCISEIHDEVFPRLYAEDEVVLKIKQSEINRYIEEKNETMFTSPICGKVCGFVFADRFVSELGNRLCKMHPEIDFVAMIDIDNCVVSYRTVKDDIDLGNDIAKLFGGGGHPKAAGSEFSGEIKLKVIENIFAK
ncbi:DHH family phosphoesterase [uncultured Eubacterium sp.]|uniref:DHH family phosphoesterase n=1 Tax=uncultured Eubacterium sp. TaxID=165185 RepID=UPI002599DD16|nr:DHHA1 domain-containing protein [uncultured Eubacterium sp.]